MIENTYPFLNDGYIAERDELFFIFLSQGKEVIPKLVVFSPIEKGGQRYYNWGFGDMIYDNESGNFRIDDKVQSNNGDAVTTFYTVISTLSIFFDHSPNAMVHIEGSNKQRAEIYRKIITRHWKQIEPLYEIKGGSNGGIASFRDGLSFEYLLVSKRKL
ncbi:DUF6934 family protein [Ohtaekwangia sp.]|uniref:DUF6934 family protein n=1 Tax=Ohtaekwangia sp. TaxID=2066019 RepID=UPI002F92F952